MNWLRSTSAVLLIFSCFYSLFGALKWKNPTEDFRIRLLKTSTLMGVFVLAVTEVLGSANHLTPIFVASCWIGALLVLLFGFQRGGLELPRNLPWMAPIVFSVLALLAVIALTAPPNTWDSMTYHMSRVMHWKAHQDINFYPTDVLRELYQYPYAEMVILHTLLLSGGDWLAGLPQFFALAGCIVGGSAIVRIWRGGERAEWYACLLAVTVPMAILQATSTQTDLVTSFWLVCFVVFTLLLRENSSLPLYAYAGASLGLAILTKPIAGIWATPFVLWYAVLLLQNPRLFTRMLMMAVIVLAIVSGTALRCIRAFGSPLAVGAEPGYSVASSRHDIAGFLTVLTRNAAIHVGAVPVRRWSTFVRNSTLGFQRLVGVAENDTSVFWPEEQFTTGFSKHEDSAGNFFHFSLMILAVPLLLLMKRQKTMLPYSLCLLVGFFLFCFLLRWQPWHSRLHLPVFMMAVPCIAVTVDDYLGRWSKVALWTLLVIQAIPFLILNTTRPLVGANSVLFTDRVRQTFVNSPDLQGPYQLVASSLLSSGCSDAGITSNGYGDDWEYPLWTLTHNRVRFEHVGVQNVTSDLGGPVTPPCAIVTTRGTIDSVKIQGRAYTRVLQASALALWK